MRIPDTFVFVDRKQARGGKHAGEWVAITTGKSISGVRLVLSATVRDVVDSSRETPVYMQLHISSNTLKLVQCEASAKGARKVGTTGYLTVAELLGMLDLPESCRYICKAEIVRNKKSLEIWATYPVELRDHIEKINGVA